MDEENILKRFNDFVHSDEYRQMTHEEKIEAIKEYLDDDEFIESSLIGCEKQDGTAKSVPMKALMAIQGPNVMAEIIVDAIDKSSFNVAEVTPDTLVSSLQKISSGNFTKEDIAVVYTGIKRYNPQKAEYLAKAFFKQVCLGMENTLAKTRLPGMTMNVFTWPLEVALHFIGDNEQGEFFSKMNHNDTEETFDLMLKFGQKMLEEYLKVYHESFKKDHGYEIPEKYVPTKDFLGCCMVAYGMEILRTKLIPSPDILASAVEIDITKSDDEDESMYNFDKSMSEFIKQMGMNLCNLNEEQATNTLNTFITEAKKLGLNLLMLNDIGDINDEFKQADEMRNAKNKSKNDVIFTAESLGKREIYT